MSLEVRYTTCHDAPRLRAFLDTYWAKDHVYVRHPALFAWTFGRRELWTESDYSCVIAEEQGEVVGMLGGVPFVMNCFGRALPGVWLANYLVHPEHRRGALALRLLNLFRQPRFSVTIAFGVSTMATPLYSALRARMLPTIPRHMAIFPAALERAMHIVHLTYPDWPEARLRALVQALQAPQPAQARGAYEYTIPPDWDTQDWPRWAACTVGAVRDSAYLRWRYHNHPLFTYHLLSAREGARTGLAVWRLETIHHATAHGREPVDRIGRLVEFLPASRANAQVLLAGFWQALRDADAIGADYYGYHSGLNAWLHSAGLHDVEQCVDGPAMPARFQPLERKGGRIASAIFAPADVPLCAAEWQCPWYWTKSDADQDRPN